ncbi:MFS transporter [Fervidobacterium riparium]|uniref:MFS transporter n=2 Tax=Fervidobacterium TaxID=2422 RepID=UPI00220774E6|nr:MFS transporter [Fervidobacterium riparium]
MDQERRYMNPYRALRNKYYRNFWVVQSISLIGTWIDTTLRGWVAVNMFAENKASGFIGLIAFLKGFPSVFFSPVAGVLIDWFGPKNILLYSQVIDAVNAFIMAYLVWKGLLSPYVLLALSLAMGITSGFYLPSRNTFISNIVPKELLPNALALHSMIFNVARMIGPTIAGFIVKSYGLQVGFIVNAISFVPLIVVLFFIPDNYSSSSNVSFKRFFLDLRDGIRYVIKNDVLSRTFIGLTMYSLFGMPFGMLMQAFVKSVVKYDILGYSLIMGMMGVGAFIGANVVASINSKRLITLREDFLLLIIGLSILAASFQPKLVPISAFIVGACQSSFFNITNSRTQLLSPSDMKGRTISLYSFINTGGSPTGTFVLGLLGNVLGVKNVYILSGIILLFFSFIRLINLVNSTKSRTTTF